jgi:hypothetical protein
MTLPLLLREFLAIENGLVFPIQQTSDRAVPIGDENQPVPCSFQHNAYLLRKTEQYASRKVRPEIFARKDFR